MSKKQIVKRKASLKSKLDIIDKTLKTVLHDGFYESRLKIELGMWEKGKAIDVFFTPLNNTVSYYQLEKDTGRRRASLKQWHQLYTSHPDKKKYLPIAKNKARIWTDKIFDSKALPLPENVIPKTVKEEELEYERKCLVEVFGYKLQELSDEQIMLFYEMFGKHVECDWWDKLPNYLEKIRQEIEEMKPASWNYNSLTNKQKKIS